jgi:hypothetical protein
MKNPPATPEPSAAQGFQRAGPMSSAFEGRGVQPGRSANAGLAYRREARDAESPWNSRKAPKMIGPYATKYVPPVGLDEALE